MADNAAIYGSVPNYIAEGSGGMVSPGAAAYQNFQTELLRRQAAQDAQDEIVRQAAKDAQDAEIKKAQLAVAQEQAASLKDQREASAKKTAQDLLLSTTKPGAVSPDVADQFQKAGLGYLMLGKPAVPAMMAGGPIENPTPEDIAASPATEAQPATTEFTGSVAQQKDAEQEAFAKEVLDGKHKTGNPRLDQFMQAQAMQILGGGKFGSIPAGVINEPKGAAETKAAHDLAMEKVESDIAQGKPVDAATMADYTVWKSRNSTDAEKAKKAADAAAAASDRTDKRTEKTQLFQTKQGFRTVLQAADAKLAPDLERVERARQVLNSPNFLTDAIAAPEVLQIMAGGMGSGLRMTDAELNRVNSAQTYLNQLKGRLAKAGIGEQVTIQAEMRKQMQDIIGTVDQAKNRLAQLTADTYRKIDSATSQEDLDNIHADYIENRNSALKGEPPKDKNKPAAGGPAIGTQGTVNGRPAVWKNGSKGLGWYAR